jgi:hypothetical protein
MSGGAHITGTIHRAYTNHDGVTHVLVNLGRGPVVSGPLAVRGEPLDDLPGCQVRSVDGGSLWTLSKARG